MPNSLTPWALSTAVKWPIRNSGDGDDDDDDGDDDDDDDDVTSGGGYDMVSNHR